MILTRQNLIEYCEAEAKDAPIIGHRLRINKTPMDSTEIKSIHEKFPTLATSYVSFIQNYDIKQVSIGYFTISPCLNKMEDFGKKLKDLNQMNEDIEDITQKHNLTHVAYTDNDDIFVAGSQSSFKEGEILALDHDDYEDDPLPIKRIAESFEQLLIICANKHQLSMTKGLEHEDYIIEMEKRLGALGLPEEYKGYWV